MTMENVSDIRETILVTHKDCMDGCGCAMMFLAAGGTLSNVRYVPAGMLEKFIKDEINDLGNKFVVFADIGLSESNPKKEEYADKLEKRGSCVLIDHHVTSTWMKDREWCNIDSSMCGTELLRRYLGLNWYSVKKMAEVIQDHDLWFRKYPESEELSTLMVHVGQDDFVRRFNGRQWDGVHPLFTDSELEILEILKRRRDESIESALRKVTVRDSVYNNKNVRIGYVISSEQNSSLLLSRMLESRIDIDVAAQVNFEKNTMSLRSLKDKNFDVSEIAKCYGGGGHRNAAGHRLPKDLVEKIIEEIHAY